uniref:Uncharacterized protein n=1 Tax=Strigamia maritima TaxID=126957 RepID=T1ILF1_STRMM
MTKIENNDRIAKRKINDVNVKTLKIKIEN